MPSRNRAFDEDKDNRDACVQRQPWNQFLCLLAKRSQPSFAGFSASAVLVIGSGDIDCALIWQGLLFPIPTPGTVYVE
jgi:hypothetical protein